MRLKTLLILSLTTLFLDCTHSFTLDEREKMEFREIAYKSLSEQDKKTVTTDWQKARVSSCSYARENNIHLCVRNSDKRDFTYDFTFITTSPNIRLKENQVLVTVMFNTIDDALLGPFIVVIEPEMKVVAGFATRL